MIVTRIIIVLLPLAITGAWAIWRINERLPKPSPGPMVQFNVPRGTKIACFGDGKPLFLGVAE